MGGRLFVISAPSGTGKTTLLRRVMAGITGLAFSVSHTTRLPRGGERNGIDYHFVDQHEFLAMRDSGVFLEWANVYGNYYGTSRREIDGRLQQGLDVILDIDVQGAAAVRQVSGLDASHIFIIPPSLQELERRLRGRGTESEEKVRTRLHTARLEMQQAGEYQYLIVNDNLGEASEMLRAIILAERARAHRRPDGRHIGLHLDL
ncbi:guanylate kinase [Desulfoprunum benzoelyticum]|uniref:Guanylate kinase n=1 Tax=Desulfoprunum benzoelyticum TaxID=1506996 RepID=A0A840USG1_9BACT|nr:guanylate kinase [Desulfoprunum benzoelyticum]MBB5347653.1 guanylate kinase [Desulfoprunum benzoelyticum]MBM9529219.1 guanylate kinase [Desulfoprunum benzoelyticum]